MAENGTLEYRVYHSVPAKLWQEPTYTKAVKFNFNNDTPYMPDWYPCDSMLTNLLLTSFGYVIITGFFIFCDINKKRRHFCACYKSPKKLKAIVTSVIFFFLK